MSNAEPAEFVLQSERVVLPDRVGPAAVRVAGGKIVDVGPPTPGDGVQDVGRLIIAPGVVDTHVHINEPGRAEWEGFRTATAAAAAGGVTTLVDMPLNSSPVTTSVEALEAKRAAAAGQCSVDVAFYGGLVPGNAGEIASLVDAGVAGVKAFLCDSGLDDFPPAGEADLLAAGAVLAPRGVPLLAHAELATGVGVTLGDTRRYSEYLMSRPPTWEADAVELLLRVCRETGCRVHVVHLANSELIGVITEAKRAGLPITVETCPHYLHFAAADIGDGQTEYKCAPPIRQASHREALWEGLVRGQIDTIGSDHSPCPPEMKQLEVGDFLRAWGGIAGLELSLPVIATGAAARGIAIERVFEWLARRPAEVFGLNDQKGQLTPGADADLIVFDPDAEWTVDAAQLRHRHKVTPYDGSRLRGRVQQTFVRGRLVYDDGKLVGGPMGQAISPTFPTPESAG